MLPKPYPNFYFPSTLTNDAIRDSGHTKLFIAFTPECRTIKFPKEGKTVAHFHASEDHPSYKLQLINLDWQESKTINIFIKK